MKDTLMITEDLINKGQSDKGGWTRKQFELLGVKWPPQAGWKKKVIGKRIPANDAEKFIALNTPTTKSEESP